MTRYDINNQIQGRYKRFRFLSISIIILQLCMLLCSLLLGNPLDEILAILSSVLFYIISMMSDPQFYDMLSQYAKVYQKSIIESDRNKNNIIFLEETSLFINILIIIHSLGINFLRISGIAIAVIASLLILIILNVIINGIKKWLLEGDNEIIDKIEQYTESQWLQEDIIDDNLIMREDIKAFGNYAGNNDSDYHLVYTEKLDVNNPWYRVSIYDAIHHNHLLVILIEELSGVEWDNLDDLKKPILYENLLQKCKDSGKQEILNLDIDSIKKIPVYHRINDELIMPY